MTSSKVAMNRTARAEQIKEVARGSLARHGAAALSLREVAREMGEASSALYRYFSTRDALVTALIVDAYNELGQAAEDAAASSVGLPPISRVVRIARVIRTWATSHPHEYALMFGSPIPNYEAPELTIGPATRIPAAFVSVFATTTLRDEPFGTSALPDGVINHQALADALPLSSPDAQARALLVWSSIFGLISFELFGHFVGSVAQGEDFFTRAVFDLAVHLGLSPEDPKSRAPHET